MHLDRYYFWCRLILQPSLFFTYARDALEFQFSGNKSYIYVIIFVAKKNNLILYKMVHFNLGINRYIMKSTMN